MPQHSAVRVEDFRFGHEAYIVVIVIDYRQIPCPGIVEGFHHFIHRVVDVNFGWRHRHESAHMHALIQVGTEHDVAYIVKQHYADQAIIVVNYRE